MILKAAVIAISLTFSAWAIVEARQWWGDEQWMRMVEGAER